MGEKLGPSQEEPQRQPEPSGDPLLDFVTSPAGSTLLEYCAPLVVATTVFRAGHYVVNSEYLAETFSGATTEEQKQQSGNFYKGLGAVFIAGATALGFKHLRKSFKRDMGRREFLIKAGGAVVGSALAIGSNLSDGDKGHNSSSK